VPLLPLQAESIRQEAQVSWCWWSKNYVCFHPEQPKYGQSGALSFEIAIIYWLDASLKFPRRSVLSSS
jgi:hypothetical protein